MRQLAGGGVSLTTAILALCWTNLREPDSANVTQHRYQIFVALNRKASKAPLPNVTTGSIVFVIPTHMAREQALHELTQRGWVCRFEHEVKVIRREAKAE
jgi:hypothetical protein